MFFFKIAEAIITNQELQTNSDLENLCDSSDDSLDELSDAKRDSELEHSEILNVLKEDDKRETLRREKVFEKGFLYNLLISNEKRERRQSLYKISKLINSKKYTNIPADYPKRAVPKRQTTPPDQIDKQQNLLKRSKDEEIVPSNYQLIESEVSNILQRISIHLGLEAPEAPFCYSRIRSNLSFLRDRLFSSQVTSKLSNRDLLVLTKFMRLNSGSVSEDSERHSETSSSEMTEISRTTMSDNNNNNTHSPVKPEPDCKMTLVQLAKKTAQPIQARINEFLKQIIDFVASNYHSIKLTADGLNNNNRSDSPVVNKKDDWIPMLKLTWHRLLALSMAEQGTDLVIVNQIHDIIANSNLSRNPSGESLTEFIKDKDLNQDPLSELFSDFSVSEDGPNEKIPNRQFADLILACLRDLQSVALQTQEYQLIRHAILFTALEPSYLPNFAMNLIKAIRAIRNHPLDSDSLMSSLNTLVVLCPKQTAALFCNHLIRKHSPPSLPKATAKEPAKFSSHLDYLLYSESLPSAKEECDILVKGTRVDECTEKMDSTPTSLTKGEEQRTDNEECRKRHTESYYANDFDCNCLCEKKVSILSTVLNSKNKSQTNQKPKVNSKLLFANMRQDP